MNIKNIFLKAIRLVMVFFVIVSSTGGIGEIIKGDSKKAEPTLNSPEWPVWVHDHWVWENEGTQESCLALVEDYLQRDIPVGAVIIDRPWATDSNTFIPDPELYPNLKEYIDKFHSLDVRVMMWATSIVNETASNYQEGKEKGYFLSGGKTVKWWGGKGALIDYTNPDAVDWWHKQMDTILDMGIDGWKVDGTDPMVMLLVHPIGLNDKFVTWAEYRDQVYRDFYEYTRLKLGKDRVISARPVDDQALQIGLPLVFTSRDINFAGWVGDNDNDWNGLQHAFSSLFASTKYNFVSYGSDIGGFRSDKNKYKDVFIRWTQLGALCPVMENGGGGEHRPWMFDEETSNIYRKYVNLHQELIPYIYSQAAYSYELVKPTMRPQLGEFIYMLGDDILVAPFFEEGNERTVVFPKGDWIYMFDETKQYSTGIKKLNFSLDEFPVYIRKGAIIPMNVTNSENNHGSALSSDYTTIAIYPEKGEKKFGLYEENEKGSMISYVKDNSSLNIKCTNTKRSMLFRIYGQPQAQSIKTADGNALQKANSMDELTTMQSGYFVENGVTWIGIKNAQNGVNIQLKY